jgi:hypothetical protein
MIRALQFATVAAFILIMVAIHQGLGFLADVQGPQFVYGALFGAAFVGGVVALCNWLERPSSAAPNSPAQHERLRNIDM